jgi:hypothetical protein
MKKGSISISIGALLLASSCATVNSIDRCSEEALGVVVEGCKLSLAEARAQCADDGILAEDCLPFQAGKMACMAAITKWEQCK